MSHLRGLRVAVIATDGFEESELKEPVQRLEREGAEVEVLSPRGGLIQAFHHDEKAGKVKVDHTLDEVRPENYDALVLPGGALSADALRTDPHVKDFVRAMHGAGKPMAVICHAPWILVSAGLVRGVKLTSYGTIQDDIRNAGGNWV